MQREEKVEAFIMKDFFYKHGDKALFALALAFVIVFLAASLFRRDGRLLPAETPGIVFTQWWEEDLGKDTLRSLAEEFEALHGIKAAINYRSYEDLRGGLFASAGNPPGDVVALDSLWLPELFGMGIIEEDFALLSFIDVLYYNVEILKEAGFSRPPKNRSEFLEYARAVVKKNRQVYALSLALGENNTRGLYDDIFPWIWAAGVQLVRDGSPVFNSRQVAEGLGFLAALNSEGLIAPDALYTGAAAKLEGFVSGRAAFMVAPAAYIARVREAMGDDAFGVTSVPAPDNYYGRPFLATAEWAIGVHSASARKEEARLFADFLGERAHLFSELTGAAPAGGSPPGRDPFYSKVWDIAISGEAGRDFAGLPWTELQTVFREELVSLFAGKSSAAEAAAAMQKKSEK